MDGERKIYLSEGVPLNSTGAANIFLNTGKDSKVNSPDGTVIHLKTEKPSDLGLHINTTFSIASSKKIKLLFVLNFLLSVICMVISCSMAFYCWNEMISMRRQLDMMKDQFFVQSLNQEKLVQSPLIGLPKTASREPRMDNRDPGLDKIPENTKKYYVEDLGDTNVILIDSKKKQASENYTKIAIVQRDLLVAHFHGAIQESNLRSKSTIGNWTRDMEVSSKNSEQLVELHVDYFTVKEAGLYLIYSQIVYLSQAPNCYFVWARQDTSPPRLLSTCATADVSTPRAINKSQMSCSVQTVARLYKNDVINMAQREPNRTVWMRPGYSYFGFIKLSS